MSLLPISKPVAEAPLVSPVATTAFSWTDEPVSNGGSALSAQAGNLTLTTYDYPQNGTIPHQTGWYVMRAGGFIMGHGTAISLGAGKVAAERCARQLLDDERASLSPGSPGEIVTDPLSPSLVDAYLDWRRVKVVSKMVWMLASDLPCGDEEDATSRFACAVDQSEYLLRDRVTDFQAVTSSDRLLKLRCLLESDDDAFQGFDHGLAPDLVALAGLVTVQEPETIQHPATDAEWRNALTANPSAIADQLPADLLRLFTAEEGGELFALAAAYRIAKTTEPDRLEHVIASLDAYGSYACAFVYDENSVRQFTPGVILTDEERADLARYGHLSTAAVERTKAAVEAHRVEVVERVRRLEDEEKAQQAAADRAKHGPPTSERLIPLLPAFSEQAREVASSLLHGASMAVTVHKMLAKHAASLQTPDLEALHALDVGALQERFQNEAQDVLRREIDHVLRARQAEVAS